MAIDQPLIAIRERRQVDLFDLALVVLRRRPTPILWATVGGVLPFLLLNLGLFRIGGEAHPTLGLWLWWLEAPLAMAPLTLVLGGMMFGQTPTVRQVTARMSASAGGLVWTHGLLRFVFAFWLPPRLLFSNEILLLERAKLGKLWRRGGDLLLGREGDLFFLACFQLVATWAIAFVVTIGLRRLSQAAIAETITWDVLDLTALTGLGFQIPLWCGAAFFTVVRFLTYIDQRIRLEGWEVELRLRAAGEALAEARRW